MTPLSTWGFSSERVSHYQNYAQENELWNSSQWLRLGHYRKNLWGESHSPILGNFFVSPVGASDPRQELLATIQLLFEKKETAQISQCRYLARTAWLKKVLPLESEDLVSCPKQEQWKRQLGAEELYIVFAASDLNSAGSSFGHTFLRVHNPKNTHELELLDYGINYAAVTGEDSGALYALKGLSGFYPGAYSMLPYYQKIREYTNLEGRDLWEYRLDFSKEEVQFLIDHLLELEGSYAPYYFTNENCSKQIMELIDVVRPDHDFSGSFENISIPLDTVKALSENNLLKEEKLRMSLQAEWRSRYSNLGYSEKRSLQNLIESKDQKILSELPAKEQAKTLEATMSYLAIQEYRQQKDLKHEKYALSVARARLGNQTDPVEVLKPKSPLQSADSVAYYFGYGKFDSHDFYRLKYRRAFHDLLSDDSGLSAFSHLEVMSFEFRYFPELQNLDLYRWIFIKILSTAPVTELDTPLSWRLDIGTEPRLSPFLNFGAGLSWDFSLFSQSRFSLFAISENYDLAEVAKPHLGLEGLLMFKGSWGRSFLSGKYLQNFSSGEAFPDCGFGISKNVFKSEIRIETRMKDRTPEIALSVVF
ncbi:DUF4105 domain-containing protein [Bdellovibrio sp.]|uniref:lipoprotein N-acyltransferase Lnb domain-containing protein n=1 Tax=Bdellovibrio sp. TaxID=28201 RepID=UPI0039E585F1